MEDENQEMEDTSGSELDPDTTGSEPIHDEVSMSEVSNSESAGSRLSNPQGGGTPDTSSNSSMDNDAGNEPDAQYQPFYALDPNARQMSVHRALSPNWRPVHFFILY